MDDVDKTQETLERVTNRRGEYFDDRPRQQFTDLTPCVSGPEDIACGKRGTPDGFRVFYRCQCGRLLNLGRVKYAGQNIDDLQYFECCACGRSTV